MSTMRGPSSNSSVFPNIRCFSQRLQIIKMFPIRFPNSAILQRRTPLHPQSLCPASDGLLEARFSLCPAVLRANHSLHDLIAACTCGGSACTGRRAEICSCSFWASSESSKDLQGLCGRGFRIWGVRSGLWVGGSALEISAIAF